jgi:UDP-N-acetylmuramate-alanine ligase
MEYVGMYHNSRIYSDYGHHPDALKQLIPSMRSLYPDHRLTILFEPHQGQRLLSLWDEFVNALAAADHVIIYTPYTAREDRSVLNIIAQKTIGQEILDADQLGHAFATQVGGQYINQIDQLGNTGDDVILVLSAGLLDSVVRDLIQG